MTDFIVRCHCNVLRQVARCDVTCRFDAQLQGLCHHPADERVNQHQHRDRRDDGHQNGFPALRGLFLVHLLQRHLHADNTQHAVLRHLVAGQAVFAQGVAHGQCGAHGAHVFTFGIGVHAERFLAAGHDLLFHGVGVGVVFGITGAKGLDEFRRTQHTHVADGAQLLDLVEEHMAFTHGARHHHARQACHRGVVHAQ